MLGWSTQMSACSAKTLEKTLWASNFNRNQFESDLTSRQQAFEKLCPHPLKNSKSSYRNIEKPRCPQARSSRAVLLGGLEEEHLHSMGVAGTFTREHRVSFCVIDQEVGLQGVMKGQNYQKQELQIRYPTLHIFAQNTLHISTTPEVHRKYKTWRPCQLDSRARQAGSGA